MHSSSSSESAGFVRRAYHQLTHHFGYDDSAGVLGDFTTPGRTVLIAIFAIVVGFVSAFVALALLKLIALFTNLFFFQRLSLHEVAIENADIGLWIVVIPVIGGLIIGLMARYGSERIRGHGIPEAIEAILLNGSRVQPRVAILKPLSSAVSIGSGGPFGAEGPIIMTGGAFGSLMGQFLRLTSVERKTLLVAGAAAGMSATFGTPVAAILLAVELLLFEWKPRSFIPVALASAVAAVMRVYLVGEPPLFPVPAHDEFLGLTGIGGALLVGLLAGGVSIALTSAVYAAEDAFHRLPIHWMWWPAIGGLAIGLGGLVFAPALGVGYETIDRLLQGETTGRLILGIIIVKSLIWAVSLGSGTSGGVLAPLLMIGGAAGALVAPVLPDAGPGFWPLIAMGAILGGTMRSPFTGIIFALELTHDFSALLPLVVAVTVAHGATVLWLRRSILTEKLSRRGFHVGREYAVDPLELVVASEVMQTTVAVLPVSLRLSELDGALSAAPKPAGQRLYPVVDEDGRLVSVVARSHLRVLIAEAQLRDTDPRLGDVVDATPVVAYPDEPLRVTVYRMAESGLTRFPVVDRADPRRLVGMISLDDALNARIRTLDEERFRQRSIRVRMFNPRRRGEAAAGPRP